MLKFGPEICFRFMKSPKRISIINLKRNYGREPALSTTIFRSIKSWLTSQNEAGDHSRNLKRRFAEEWMKPGQKSGVLVRQGSLKDLCRITPANNFIIKRFTMIDVTVLQRLQILFYRRHPTAPNHTFIILGKTLPRMAPLPLLG